MKRYFGTNENYCFGKTIPPKDTDGAMEDDLVSFYKVTSGSKKFDQRAKAAEIHLSFPLPVNNNLFMLVLPKYHYKLHLKKFESFMDGIKNVPKIFYNDSYEYSLEEIVKR
ncbi:MAG: hypothetical protein IPN43_06240 [Chitinophagaceae bacterium]|nr:hypothetical protein [Chitinophagaceae bacterium]